MLGRPQRRKRYLMPGQRPDPTPEGKLIRRAMQRKGVNAPDVAPLAGISTGRWRHIVNGAQPLGRGQYHRVVAPADTLAKMAMAVDLTPEQLQQAGRGDAAAVLRELLAVEAPRDRFTDPQTGEVYVDPDERDLWRLNRLPADTRRRLIYYLRADRAREQAEQQQTGRRTA